MSLQESDYIVVSHLVFLYRLKCVGSNRGLCSYLLIWGIFVVGVTPKAQFTWQEVAVERRCAGTWCSNTVVSIILVRYSGNFVSSSGVRRKVLGLRVQFLKYA